MADEQRGPNPEDGRPEPTVRVVDRRWWARDAAAEDADQARLRKPTYVEELEQRLADMQAQLQAVAAERRQSADEFEQAKARIRREVSRDVERGKRAIITELLGLFGARPDDTLPEGYVEFAAGDDPTAR